MGAGPCEKREGYAWDVAAWLALVGSEVICPTLSLSVCSLWLSEILWLFEFDAEEAIRRRAERDAEARKDVEEVNHSLPCCATATAPSDPVPVLVVLVLFGAVWCCLVL